jgi:hypothetical protein
MGSTAASAMLNERFCRLLPCWPSGAGEMHASPIGGPPPGSVVRKLQNSKLRAGREAHGQTQSGPNPEAHRLGCLPAVESPHGGQVVGGAAGLAAQPRPQQRCRPPRAGLRGQHPRVPAGNTTRVRRSQRRNALNSDSMPLAGGSSRQCGGPEDCPSPHQLRSRPTQARAKTPAASAPSPPSPPCPAHL